MRLTSMTIILLLFSSFVLADSINEASIGVGILSYDQYGFVLSKDGVKINITPTVELKSGSFKAVDYGTAIAEVKGNTYEFTYNISIPNNGTGTAFTGGVANITFLQTSDKPLKVIGNGMYYYDYSLCTKELCYNYYTGVDYSILLDSLQQNYTIIDRDGKNLTYQGTIPYSFSVDKNNIGRAAFDVSGMTFAKGQTIVLDPTIITIVDVSNQTSVKNNISTNPSPEAHITPNDTSIQFYLPFNTALPSPTNISYDYSNNGKNATINNKSSTLWGASQGFYGGGIVFPGVLNTKQGLKFTNGALTSVNKTVAFWLYLNRTLSGVNQYIIDDNTWTWGFSGSCEATDTKLCFGDRTAFRNTGYVVPNGAWTHVVGVMNGTGGTAQLWINGTYVTTVTWTPTNLSNTFCVGAFSDCSTSGSYLNGSVDELIAFNKTLVKIEIESLFFGNFTRFGGPPAILRFENLTVGQDGTVNSLNVTSNTTLLNASQLGIRIWEYNRTLVNTRNSSWQYLASGDNIITIFGIGTDTYNISVEYNFSAGSTSFYSPVLKDSIAIPTYSGGVLVSSNDTLTKASTAVNVTSEQYPLQHMLINDTSNVIYLPFDVNLTGGNTNISYDYAQYSNDAVGNNGVFWNTSGQIGGAMQFDGSGTKMTVADAANIQTMNNFTMAAWIRPYSYGGASKGRIVDKVGILIWDVNNVDCTAGIDFNVFFNSGGSTEVCANNVVGLNTWQHVVIVYNGTGQPAISCMTIYINGTIKTLTTISTTTGARSSDAGVLAIGSRSTDTARVFNGLIDEFMIYNKSLTTEEVNALYQSRVARYAGPLSLLQYQNVSLGQNGSFNFINLTMNATILNNSNLSVVVLQIGSNGVNVLNTSVYYLPSGTNQITNINLSANPTNITLIFNFTGGGNNFYSPVFHDMIQISNAQVPNATGGAVTTPGLSSVIYSGVNTIIEFGNNMVVQSS